MMLPADRCADTTGHRPRQVCRRRFSLIEIVSAVLLPALVLTPLIAMMVQCARMVQEASMQRTALGIADDVLSLAVQASPGWRQDLESRDFGVYSVDLRVAACRDEPRLEVVTVTVSWKIRNEIARTISLKALRLRSTGASGGGSFPQIPASSALRPGSLRPKPFYKLP